MATETEQKTEQADEKTDNGATERRTTGSGRSATTPSPRRRAS